MKFNVSLVNVSTKTTVKCDFYVTRDFKFTYKFKLII